MRKTLLMGLCLVFLMGCVGFKRINEDLTQDPQFVSLIGKQYKTKMEFVIYSSQDSKEILKVDQFNQRFPRKEKIVPPFPMKYQNKLIHGVLPMETEFKVVSVRLQGTQDLAFIRPYVEIIKSPDPQCVGKVIYPYVMTDYDMKSQLPVFEEKYVEEIESQ